MGVITASGLSKSFGDMQAVRDVSLDIERGEVFGLLGSNGAGKTTTIRILTGQTTPDTGTVSVLGVNPVEDPVGVREQVGILPERESPPSFMTPREYFDLVGDIRNMDADVLADRVDTWTDRLEFAEQLDTLHTDLSRGQQQKVMIAQAFLHEPDVVIIDEPLVNLDPMMQVHVKDAFVKYAREDRTVLLSTHDLPVAEEICTTVGIMQNGQLTAERDLTDASVDESLLETFKTATERSQPVADGGSEGV